MAHCAPAQTVLGSVRADSGLNPKAQICSAFIRPGSSLLNKSHSSVHLRSRVGRKKRTLPIAKLANPVLDTLNGSSNGALYAPYGEETVVPAAARPSPVDLPGSGLSNGVTNGASHGASNGAVNGATIAVRNGAPNGAFLLPSQTLPIPASTTNGASSAAYSLQPLSPKKLPSQSRGSAQVEELVTQVDPWFKESVARNVQVSVAPGGRWSKFKGYSTLQRSLEIWGFVFAFVFKSWLLGKKWTYRGGMTEEKQTSRRRDLAKWLKEGLLRLGPTFIKIGQQFSTRADILPKEYIDELGQLQDQVPPFDSATAIAIVEKELGKPVDQIFERFDRDPIAAASLGQVHRARLNGREIVVKVQRPGLKALFDVDLKNLRVIAQNLQKIDPKSDGAKRDWVAIYDECASVLYEEIDYMQEGRNADRFRSNFAELPYVKVPDIIWEYTTPQVLTMEYVPGIKINRIADLDRLGIDRKQLARYCVESYLEQILRHGFFHADPHPGNIAVDDVNGGRLIIYDFGMMGSISSSVREGLVEAFYGVYEKDPDKVLDALVSMGVLVETGDRTAVRRTASFFLNSFETRLAAQKIEQEEAEAERVKLGGVPLTKEQKMDKKKLRLAAIGEDLLTIGVDQPFRFPATFTFVVRAFSVLDGIGKGLDPRFDISEIARPYALEILRFREAGANFFLKDLKTRWDRQARAFYNLFRQADRVEKLAEVITKLEQGDLKLRVRALESERSFKRVAAVQATILNAVVAAALLNLATVLQLHAVSLAARCSFIGAGLLTLRVVAGLLGVKKLDRQEKLITGTA